MNLLISNLRVTVHPRICHPGSSQYAKLLLPRMTLQECEGLLVELLYFFIYGRVGAAFENDQFNPLNVGLHPIGKACGRDHVVEKNGPSYSLPLR